MFQFHRSRGSSLTPVFICFICSTATKKEKRSEIQIYAHAKSRNDFLGLLQMLDMPSTFTCSDLHLKLSFFRLFCCMLNFRKLDTDVF